MSQPQNLETTLGHLIVALTDEATSLVPDPKSAYWCVSHILSELVRKKLVRFKNNYRSQFSHILTNSSVDQLVRNIKEKRLAASGKGKKSA